MPIPTLYSISRHAFTTPDGIITATNIYSGGNTGILHNPADVNNPLCADLPDYGPIPFGIWTMTEMIVEGAETGPYSIRLAPDSATRAYILAIGRGPDSFLIHPDGILTPGRSSKGCICAEPEAFRIALWALPCKIVIVVP